MECRPDICIYLPMPGPILVEISILHQGRSPEHPKSSPNSLRLGMARHKIGPEAEAVELPASERLSLHFRCQGPPGSPEVISVELGPVPVHFDLRRDAGSRESYWSRC